MLYDMEHGDCDLRELLQLSSSFRESNSKDLATRIKPGLHVHGDTVDEIENIVWLLQFLSKPFGVAGSFSVEAISLQDALLSTSPSPLVS
jgi:hypothetical protein